MAMDEDDRRALWKARRKGDEPTQRWLLRVPPSDGSGSPDPGRALGREPALEFPTHRQALVSCLRSARGVEPRQCLADWAARVERLDLARPADGLAELSEIAGEYEQARRRYASPFSALTRPLWLDDEAARIGGEIREVAELLSEAMRQA